MDNKTQLLLVLAFAFIFIPLCLGLPLWIMSRMLKKSAQPLSNGIEGMVTVPVGLLIHSDWISSSRNSLNPRLEIAPDGLNFRVISAAHWPFANIVQVDTPWVPFTTRIAFRTREDVLSADVADRAKARDLLRALPATLPFAPRGSAARRHPLNAPRQTDVLRVLIGSEAALEDSRPIGFWR